jgi:hypothetical protein
MGIITSLLMYSKLSVADSNLAGVSLGKAGYVVGGWVVWAAQGPTKSTLNATERQTILPRRKIVVRELCTLKPRSLLNLLIDPPCAKECTGEEQCEQPSAKQAISPVENCR